MLAAQAVAEAEETSRKASDLLDAANAVEELEHSLHDRQSKNQMPAIATLQALHIGYKRVSCLMHAMTHSMQGRSSGCTR